ncbi:MAG: outer membrane lipoprotein chaperone LolA [SAR324 cluster bacterium]|nr:outer membrane lipoprotein chaperone LolA [SAR324 cluster bacterium]
MKKYLIILSFFFLSGILSQTLANEANILQYIQAQYQSILSFSGYFTQTSFRANSKTTPRKARGEVSYKRPGKMRWMYVAPEDQLLVTNGDTLWLYDTLLENVTIQKLNKLTDGTALSFLLGLGDLNNDFKRRKISKPLLKNPQGLIVELEPIKETVNLAFIQLEVDPKTYNLRTIALMDHQANYRTIALESMTYNLALEDKFFEFEVSAEMEVINADN